MTLRRSLALVVCSVVACSAGLAGCAPAPGPSEITTGSLLPKLPSPASFLPSAGALVPALGGPSSSGPRRPERVSGNLYRVFADDRKIEDGVQRENYTLLRAAESARQVGGTHFVIVGAGQGRPDVGGPQAGTPVSGQMIRVMRLDSDMPPPTGAISVDEIIHFFGPTFGRAPEPIEGEPPRQG